MILINNPILSFNAECRQVSRHKRSYEWR